MRLCFSTYASILVKGKARTTSQVELIRALFGCLPNHFDAFDDAGISDIVNGKKNVPDDDVILAKSCDPRTVSVSLKDGFLKLLDNNKKGCIVLALKDVIRQDSDLNDDTQIELINGITKAAFLQRDTLVYADLLAGLFLYVLIYTQNHSSRAFAKQITDDYLNGFKPSADSIAFLDSYGDAPDLKSVELPTDAHTAALLAEAESKCIRCGRPIAVGGDNAVKRATLVTLPDGTDIVTCADCACVVAAMNEAEQKALTEKQMAARELNRIRDDIAIERIDGDIEAVLRSVDQLDEDDNTELRLDPLTIDKKVSEKRLREHIRTDVLSLYPGVNEILDRLAGEGRINPTRFARQIRRIFENAASPVLSERKIYDLIVDKLNTVSGGRYKTACEVIVSYFVQRCEVFNEIAE